MSDLRTPEQVEADEALLRAIEQVNEAYDPGAGDVLGAYIVIADWSKIDEDGDVEDALMRHCRFDMSRTSEEGLIARDRKSVV